MHGILANITIQVSLKSLGYLSCLPTRYTTRGKFCEIDLPKRTNKYNDSHEKELDNHVFKCGYKFAKDLIKSTVQEVLFCFKLIHFRRIQS